MGAPPSLHPNTLLNRLKTWPKPGPQRSRTAGNALEAETDARKPAEDAENARVDPQPPLRSDELARAHSRAAPTVDNASESPSKPSPEQPKEGNRFAQSRLNHRQNRIHASPVPKAGPKLPNRPLRSPRLPNAEPHAALGGQLPRLITELPNPTASSQAVRQSTPIAPMPNGFPATQNRIEARLDDRRTVALEWNAERRKKTDGQRTARTTALHPPHAQPHHSRKPNLPKIHPFAPNPRPAERTTPRNLRLNLRIVRRIRLNRANEKRK